MSDFVSECKCSAPDPVFDRSLCACGAMHDYCGACGNQLDGCDPDPAERSILEEAAELVSGTRQLEYGHPIENHGCTAAMWSAYLSRKLREDIVLDAEDVCWLNALQKVSRQANLRQRDNLVDAIGYVANIELLD